MASRALTVVDAPRRADDVRALLSALSGAVDGSGPPLLVLPPAPAQLRAALVDRAAVDQPVPNDVAVVVATSGTTGAPRLVMLSSAALHAAAAGSQSLLGGSFASVLALPASSIGGLMSAVRANLGDAPIEVLDTSGRFRAQHFIDGVASLRRSAPRWPLATSVVPTQLHRLLQDDTARAALRQLDVVLVGGAACPESLRQSALDASVNLVSTYGMTETCGGCVYDGVAMPGTQVHCDEAGRIFVRGPTLFAGYRTDQQLTDTVLVDGWLRTQDLGEMRDGRLVVAGRVDDIVVVGGVNVSVLAVEHAVSRVPGVREVVVVAMDDEEWGKWLVAVLVSDTEVGLSDVRNHVAATLGAAAAPRQVLLVDTLPALASGKVDRRAAHTLVARSVRRAEEAP